MIKDALLTFGLTEKETKIYLVLLKMGKAKASQIADKAHLPRTTVYNVLDSLSEKGLIFTFCEGKIKTYTPHDPQKIVNQAAEQSKVIKSIFPDLQKIYASSTNTPHITYHKGIDSMKEMYMNILQEKNLKEYDIIASEENWLTMDSTFVEHFKKKRSKAQIKTRLILEYSETALQRKKNAYETFSEVKIIPPGFDWNITSGCYIFKDKVIFIAYKDEHVACVIHSSEIASLLKTMFNFMWGFLSAS